MKISALQHAVPSQRITNDWIVERIREQSAGSLQPGELDRLESRLRAAFATAGTRVRYALAEGERAVDIVLRAGIQALERAGLEASDIDFLIYTGVGRGWLEPAAATVVQHELGLLRATSFDVMDACASWLRALHVAHSFIRTGTYRRGMIVNCECGLLRFADFAFRDLETLDHEIAGYTIGEAATATIVTDGRGDDDFYFTFRTFARHFELCMIPLPTVESFRRGPPDPRLVPWRFFTLSGELFSRATTALIETFESDERLRSRRYDISFGHEASAKVSEIVTTRLGVDHIYFPTHGAYGNTVSASVPLGMSLALEQGRLKRGDQVLIIVGSAGMTVGFAAFTF